MKNGLKNHNHQEKIENEKTENNSDSEEENESQEDVDSGVKLDQFITTPYERVLSIINEAKAFIISVSKDQQALIKGLEWSIKVISSHSLYSYELKDQDYLNQMSEDNPDFKQFVDFVNNYNDQFINMNRRNAIGGVSALNTKRGTTRKSSMEEEIKKNEQGKKKEKMKNTVEENNNRTIDDNNFRKAKKHKSERNVSQKVKDKSKETIDVQSQIEEANKKRINKENINNKKKVKKKSLLKLLKHSFSNDIDVKIENPNSSTKTLEKIIPNMSHNNLKMSKSNSSIKKRTIATSKSKNSKNNIYNGERKKKWEKYIYF